MAGDTDPPVVPYPLRSILLDTGALGANFINQSVVNELSHCLLVTPIVSGRSVRLGNQSVVTVNTETVIPLTVHDHTGAPHTHKITCVILPNLSHDVIIGLFDLFGSFYDLFATSIRSARSLMSSCRRHVPVSPYTLTHVAQHTPFLGSMSTTTSMDDMSTTTPSAYSLPDDIFFCGACVHDISTHTQHHATTTYDFRPTHSYDTSACYLCSIRDVAMSRPPTSMLDGELAHPWSQPLDEVAPEEVETPDPLFFGPDILSYLSTTLEEARAVYDADLLTHVTPELVAAVPRVTALLKSPKAYEVFVPTRWTGIKIPPLHLDTKPGLPDSLRPRPRPIRPAIFEPATTEFHRMESYMFLDSTSPIACPLVVAPKATFPFIRICGDYRPVNPFIIIPPYPIPNVQHDLMKAAGFKIFVDLDMTNSFHQIPIDDATSNLLSVSTPWGLKRPRFLPEGVGPASGILQSIVRKVFHDFLDWTIVIFDNFLVLAHSYEDAVSKLEKIIDRCFETGLILKMKKSWIGATTVTFFGYEVKPGSWALSQTRKDAIAAFVFPDSVKQMQSFLGAANFFHNHVPNYAQWSSHLYEMTTSTFDWKDKSTWKRDYLQLFNDFKVALTQSLVLHFPDYSLEWVIRCDASSLAVAAILYQVYVDADGNNIPQLIHCASHKLSGPATRWHIFKQEAYALYFGISHFEFYLRGKPFLMETDHQNLLWMEASSEPIIVRWRVYIQGYIATLKHLKGTDNKFADWLTRMFPLMSLDLSVGETYPAVLEMFRLVHGGRNLHHGYKRTYYNLCQRFPGHGVPIRIIQQLVSECPTCQKDRLPLTNIPHNEHVETLTQHERVVGIDHITVTPHSEDGHVGILAVIEHDQKYAQFYAVRDYTAVTVASNLFKHYCTFGTYNGVLSDPGSAFMSDVVNHLNTWLGIPSLVSLVGRHESNGTEHVNCLFMGHLRRLVHDERLVTNWSSDTVLPLITHAILTTPNDELGGLTPIELKFGTSAFHYFTLPSLPPAGTNYHPLLQSLNDHLTAIREVTADFQSDLRSWKKRHNSHLNIFQPGDLILWNPKETPTSLRSSKLQPKFLGPYCVIKQTHNDVLCKHVTTNIEYTFHSSRIYPFFGSIQDAKKCAIVDTDEYDVEAILDHAGNIRRKTSMRFLVKWLGYSDAHTSWEPYNNLKDNSILHQYLDTHKMSHLKPPSHTL